MAGQAVSTLVKDETLHSICVLERHEVIAFVSFHSYAKTLNNPALSPQEHLITQASDSCPKPDADQYQDSNQGNLNIHGFL
ncbi:hypothetical protein ACFS07_36580 [Undibacterium arcticum]